MTHEQITIRAWRDHHSFGNEIPLRILCPEQKAEVKSITFEPVKDGEYLSSLIVLKDAQAQILMDDLWACGIRPTEGTGSAGAMAAVQEHLKDMRQIAYDSLKKAGIGK